MIQTVEALLHNLADEMSISDRQIEDILFDVRLEARSKSLENVVLFADNICRQMKTRRVPRFQLIDMLTALVLELTPIESVQVPIPAFSG